MEYLKVTQAEMRDVLLVFAERGIEILHSIQDDAVRIYSHFDEVEAILWSARLLDGLESLISPKVAIDTVISRAEVEL